MKKIPPISSKPDDTKAKHQKRFLCTPAVLEAAKKMLLEAQTPEDIQAARDLLRRVHKPF